jgi:hypothetical protein
LLIPVNDCVAIVDAADSVGAAIEDVLPLAGVAAIVPILLLLSA